MICVTGLEPTLDALAQRLERHAGALQEVRLDALDRIDDDVFRLLRSLAPIIVTCRSTVEGGHFNGTANEQAALLERALDTNPACLDLELSAAPELRERLFRRRGVTKLITSLHRFEPAANVEEDFRRLARQPGDLLKYAVQIDDAAELIPLLRTKPPDDRSLLRIGMGGAGVLSRALYTSFGSPWTYAAADAATASASGQLTVSRAEAWRIGQSRHPVPYGLLGGPQVHSSPGMDVYNHLFAGYDLDAVYLPVQTARPREVLALLRALEFAGISVTMPAKIDLLRACDDLSPDAVEAGAINTIIFKNKGLYGDNTDTTAIREVLGDTTGEVLILGAGGIARAALAAVGERAVVSARDQARALAVARDFGASAIPWEQRVSSGAKIIFNATPLGSDSVSCPLPPKMTLEGRLIVDAVMSREGTPLIRRATAVNRTAVDGFGLWVRQGATQMSRFLDRTVTSEELEEILEEARAGVEDG